MSMTLCVFKIACALVEFIISIWLVGEDHSGSPVKTPLGLIIPSVILRPDSTDSWECGLNRSLHTYIQTHMQVLPLTAAVF